MKKLFPLLAALLISVAALAQGPTGGIKATVVSRAGRAPIADALVQVVTDGVAGLELRTDAEGRFFIPIENGSYSLLVSAPGFLPTQVNVVVDGYVRDLVFVTLTPVQETNDVDDDSFTEFDLQDSGYTDNPTILFGANDVYTNVAGYGFSAVRFKNRGFDTESQQVLLAGVPLNDAITGYSPYSLWTGLNEAMRSKDTTVGLEASDLHAGSYNGVTNINAMPSAVRKGWRFSVLSNSALYRLRLMGTYASGELDNGWSYAFNVSARLGGNDWIEGVYYRSFAFYGGVEKKFGDEHKLGLIAFATPGERGAQNASTQEVYDLMGDNMYNSNWGYQNGKVRNSRVRKTFEPVVALKYTYTPSSDFTAGATLLWRTGSNGYTALDWYDAMDPRPDYYRNLPSYFKVDESDYNRHNLDKSEWAEYAWTDRSGACTNYQHLNWDRLYNVNYNNPEGRSKYALEERHVDQNDINLALNTKWRASEVFTLAAGVNLKYNRTENYKAVNDLLGGKYYLNVDQFAERDFAATEALIQNDLDYYLANGEAEKISKGGKYGYDYLAQIRKGQAWANGTFTFGGFSAILSGTVGCESFWREGLVRKGLFAGLDDQGREIIDPKSGKVLTNYDDKGRVISSKGLSDVSTFLTYSGKATLQYVVRGGHRFAVSGGYFSDAPTFNKAFVSARTRNTLVDNLTNKKTFSADATYQFSNNGYHLRLTGFYTTIKDQTDVMSFYDDSQQSFTNFAMTGIDQRHAGVEFGAKIPLFVQGLTLTGVLSYGEYIYTSTPHMVQTVDNSAALVRDEDVPYWQTSPIFKTVKMPDGSIEYDEDVNGNPIEIGRQKHYVPSTPQLAAELALNYRTRSYWFFELNGQYFDKSYLSMNPLYRTHFACSGGDGIETPDEIVYMTTQEKFDPAFLVNLSIGKSWYINRKYNFGFSLEAKNLANDTWVKTGGYEQTRLIKSEGKDRYYRFDPKYFYMCGRNFMLNLYFKF